MNRSAWLAAIIVFFTVACHSDKNPFPTNPTTPTPSLSNVSFQTPGPTSVGPGQTAQMTAVARFSDGSTRTVTDQATWTSSQPQIATVAAGVVTGRALGRTQIRAAYQNRSTSLNIVVEPDGTFIVSGNITEPGSVAVSGATVSVPGNPPNQVVSPSGFYEIFGVSGTVMLTVSKPGYLDETRTLQVTQNQKMDVQIRPIVAPTAVAGDYRMTLTISPSCTIVPDDQKTRTYTATIEQDNARLTIRLSDATFVSSKNTATGAEFGSTVTIDFGNFGFYYYYYAPLPVQEIIPGGLVLGIWGKVVAPVSAQSISGNLVGGFTYGAPSKQCLSGSDSKVVLTKK
jgi:hypothetical protein